MIINKPGESFFFEDKHFAIGGEAFANGESQ